MRPREGAGRPSEGRRPGSLRRPRHPGRPVAEVVSGSPRAPAAAACVQLGPRAGRAAPGGPGAQAVRGASREERGAGAGAFRRGQAGSAGRRGESPAPTGAQAGHCPPSAHSRGLRSPPPAPGPDCPEHRRRPATRGRRAPRQRQIPSSSGRVPIPDLRAPTVQPRSLAPRPWHRCPLAPRTRVSCALGLRRRSRGPGTERSSGVSAGPCSPGDGPGAQGRVAESLRVPAPRLPHGRPLVSGSRG